MSEPSTRNSPQTLKNAASIVGRMEAKLSLFPTSFLESVAVQTDSYILSIYNLGSGRVGNVENETHRDFTVARLRC